MTPFEGRRIGRGDEVRPRRDDSAPKNHSGRRGTSSTILRTGGAVLLDAGNSQELFSTGPQMTLFPDGRLLLSAPAGQVC